LRRGSEEEREQLHECTRALEAELTAAYAGGTGGRGGRHVTGAIPRSGMLNGSGAESVAAVNDALAELRAMLRAASDETAAMPPSAPSVHVVADALSQATEQLENARAHLRALLALVNSH
jgi:hypothetical protein